MGKREQDLKAVAQVCVLVLLCVNGMMLGGNLFHFSASRIMSPVG